MIELLRGMRDIYPPETAVWEKLYFKASELFNTFNYKQILTPVLEKTELFSRSVGASSDIVNKEMYTFIDRGEDSVTLRPEGTASVMRAYLANSDYRDKFVKLWYWGPMYRYERPQKGRYRQFNQFGLEAICSQNPIVDAELIYILNKFYTELGLNNLSLEVNSVGCKECRPAYKDNLVDYFTQNNDKLCDDCKRRLLQNPLRILDCKVETCKILASKAPIITEHLCTECDTHFKLLKEYLDNLNLKYTLNPFIVRGLDYYTKTVFEFTSLELGGRQNALGGGGRYDELSLELGGKKVPSVGFAGGIERLILLLEPEIFSEKQIYLAVLDDTTLKNIFPLILKLKETFKIIDDSFKTASPKKFLEKALKNNIRFILFCGTDDFAKKQFLLKDLKLSIEHVLNFSDLNILTDKISEILGG